MDTATYVFPTGSAENGQPKARHQSTPPMGAPGASILEFPREAMSSEAEFEATLADVHQRWQDDPTSQLTPSEQAAGIAPVTQEQLTNPMVVAEAQHLMSSSDIVASEQEFDKSRECVAAARNIGERIALARKWAMVGGGPR